MQKRILSLMLALAMMITVFSGLWREYRQQQRKHASQSAASRQLGKLGLLRGSVLPDQPIQRRRDRGADEHWL